MLGVHDPEVFYGWPEHLQTLWLEHAANLWTGAYQPRPEGPQSAADARRIQQEGIERARRAS